MKKYLLLSLCLLLLFGGCNKKAFKQEKRSFYMGVTPWPPDFSNQGVARAYDFINTKCDLISNHFDDGIPWQEALNGTPYPEVITKNIEKRLNNNHGRIVYLALAPLAFSRTGKAGYWGTETPDSIRTHWDHISFDDTLASNAYFNFCCYLIDAFHPQYFNYAVEANSRDWTDAEFAKFLTFLGRVYPRLKQKYTTLPVFASYMVTINDSQLERAKQLNQYSDFISISSYPYFEISSAAYGSTEPVNIPKDFYAKYRNIDLSKPFAVAETGYIAEDLYLPEYGVSKKGNPQWQADYLQYLFEICNDYHAEFVTYFCAYDYDNAYNSMVAVGLASPSFKMWKDIGFYDGQGMKRPSLQVWEKWYQAERK